MFKTILEIAASFKATDTDAHMKFGTLLAGMSQKEDGAYGDIWRRFYGGEMDETDRQEAAQIDVMARMIMHGLAPMPSDVGAVLNQPFRKKLSKLKKEPGLKAMLEKWGPPDVFDGMATLMAMEEQRLAS